MTLDLTRSLTRDGDNYRLESSGKNFLIKMKESADFRLTDSGIEGIRFTSKVKTLKTNNRAIEFDRELGKLFINVCTHEEIDRPTAQEVTAPDGRQGQTWSMPHLCSPKVKEEKDRAGHKCSVVDIVFHPEVVSRCDAPPPAGERWKEMVASTAVEMVGKLHQLDLDPQYKLLKVRYFGDTGEGPSTMSWKPASAFEGKGETVEVRAAPSDDSVPQDRADAPLPNFNTSASETNVTTSESPTTTTESRAEPTVDDWILTNTRRMCAMASSCSYYISDYIGKHGEVFVSLMDFLRDGIRRSHRGIRR